MGSATLDLYDDLMIRSPQQSRQPPLASHRLSDQLADDLRRQIEAGTVLPGQRLPTEQALATQYAVSRTVVREAVSRLRSSGLLVARQGSGMFVAALDAARPLDFDSSVLADLGAVLDVVEVRRALESEVAALAATRATPAQRRAIQAALAQADASIASGSATVDEDLAFHQTLADAAGNPQFARRNESMKTEFISEVRQEHQAIVDAILARDADAARAAAARHMHQAARRLQDGDAPIRRAAAHLQGHSA
jgi:GntR family transcriptional repressor for pyruvate dehydrogenase complex